MLAKESVGVNGGLVVAAEAGVGAEDEVNGSPCLLVFEDEPGDRRSWIRADTEVCVAAASASAAAIAVNSWL